MMTPMPQKNAEFLSLLDKNLTNDKINTPIQSCQTPKAKLGLCCVFNPKSTLIDKNIPEYVNSTPLTLPNIPANDPWTLDGLIDSYGELYSIEELLKLLFIFSDNNAGLGYSLEKADYQIYNWTIDKEKKIILIDQDEKFSTRTNQEAAKTLKNIIETEFEGKESFWDTAWRMTIGTGKTVIGVGEMLVGAAGIILPEPGTSVAGVVLLTLGANNTVEGITQLFNFNEGNGVNLLQEGAGSIGYLINGKDGESAAELAFTIANIIVSLGGAYKIIKIPNKDLPDDLKNKLIFKGTYTRSGFGKYWPEDGFSIGRLQLNYPLPKANGKVLINITNNKNEWFVRFQKINKKLVMNGRSINVNKVHRLDNTKEMIKFLIQLAIKNFK